MVCMGSEEEKKGNDFNAEAQRRGKNELNLKWRAECRAGIVPRQGGLLGNGRFAGDQWNHSILHMGQEIGKAGGLATVSQDFPRGLQTRRFALRIAHGESFYNALCIFERAVSGSREGFRLLAGVESQFIPQGFEPLFF